MANEVNIYSPRYLAEVVRQTPAVHTYFRDTFFTNVKTFATERVDIDLVKGDRRMAAFVHPRVGGKVLKANGYQTESYKPPLINPYDVTTADQLMTRLPGEDLYSGMTPAQRAAQKLMEEYATPVSYTHLDVYKRQLSNPAELESGGQVGRTSAKEAAGRSTGKPQQRRKEKRCRKPCGRTGGK